LSHRVSIVHVANDRQATQRRGDLAQQFEPLAGKVNTLIRRSSDITARMGQASDQPAPYRIGGQYENDWNSRSRLFHRGDRTPSGPDNIPLASHELCCELGEALAAAFSPAIFNSKAAAFHPSEFRSIAARIQQSMAASQQLSPYLKIRW